MKNICKAILTVVMAVVLSACGGSPGTIGDGRAYEPEQAEFIGIVKPLGVSIYQEGTHRLESNGRLVAILQSRKFSLGAFEEAEVQVKGNVKPTVEGSQKIMTVDELEVLKPAKERIKTTQSYISPYHSFRFELAPDWMKLEESRSRVAFGHEGQESHLFVFSAEELRGEFASWLKNVSFTGFTMDAENIFRIHGENATRRIFSDAEGEQIISVSLPVGSMVYHLLYDSRGANDAIADKGSFYDLLDSFEFGVVSAAAVQSATPVENKKESVEQQTASAGSTERVMNENVTEDAVQRSIDSDFATFTSNALKFSASIPKSWYYSGFAGVTGVIYRYGFTDYKTYRDSGDDINLGNTIATLDIVSGTFESLREGNAMTIGGREVYVSTDGPELAYYFRRDDKTTFVVKGYPILKPILEKIVASVVVF